MKAIFLKNIDGKLTEVDRREVKDSTNEWKVFSIAPTTLHVDQEPGLTTVTETEETWVCISRGLTPTDPSFFVLDKTNKYVR